MTDEVKKFLNAYGDFVTKVTSKPSLNQSSLDERMKEIDSSSEIKTIRQKNISHSPRRPIIDVERTAEHTIY